MRLVLVGHFLLHALERGVRGARLALQLEVLVPQRAVLFLRAELLELDLVGLLLDLVERAQQLRVLLAQDAQRRSARAGRRQRLRAEVVA